MQAQTDPGLDIAIVGGGISGPRVRLPARAESTTSPSSRRGTASAGTRTRSPWSDRTGPTRSTPGSSSTTSRTTRASRRLLARLDVASQPTSMSFSVRCDRTGTEYNGSSLNQVFAQRRNLLRPRFLGMVRDILRFNREARRARSTTWTRRRRSTSGSPVDGLRRGVRRALSRAAGQLALVLAARHLPAASPSGSSSSSSRNHAMLDLEGRPAWRVIQGGSRALRRAPHARASATASGSGRAVRRVTRGEDGVRVETATGPAKRFDEVIFACHSDQALRDARGRVARSRREVLGAFPYESNEVGAAHRHLRPAASPPGLGELELPRAERTRRSAPP